MNRKDNVIVSIYVAINLTLLSKLHVSADIRSGIADNYVRNFNFIDVIIFFAIFAGAYGIILFANKYAIPTVVHKLRCIGESINQAVEINLPTISLSKNGILKVVGFIGLVYVLFLAAFYPGTAMNDTIYVIQEPWELGAQHPITYNLFVNGCYQIGKLLGDANYGLFIISIIQTALIIYVISYGIMVAYKNGHNAIRGYCYLLVLYYAFAPIYSLYAFTGIKDTIFSAALFYIVISLSEMAVGCTVDWMWTIKFIVALMLVTLFRNGGIIIALAAVACLVLLNRQFVKRVIVIGASIVFINILVLSITKPMIGEQYSSEKMGIAIQQVAAVATYEDDFSAEEWGVLSDICSKEVWVDNYAPACVDMIKWHPAFDKNAFNRNKNEFAKIWIKAGARHPDVYVKAYLLGTYGFWGIETHNSEQYYEKEIFANDLGLYPEPKFPSGLAYFIKNIYCNRFTLRYMSAGTAIFILLVVAISEIANGDWKKAVPLMPIGVLWGGLMCATPIAFCFRYVFVVALIIPVLILLYGGRLIDSTEY